MTTLRTYVIRHGAMRHVGRFTATDDFPYRRGDTVVVRSPRGDELGEVIAETDTVTQSPLEIIRLASPLDLERGREVAEDRGRRLSICERIFQDGEWPLELIDVEPMLNDRRTVLLYLGPHRLNSEGLIHSLREFHQIEAILEPVGLDVGDEEEAEPDHEHASCGTGGGCGEGGCGEGGCGTGSSGCSSCTIKDLVSKRKVALEH